jgi:hypothetical protein
VNLGDQFLAIITPRTLKLGSAAEVVAVDIKDRMLENTSEGRSWPTTSAQEYVPIYTAPYAKRAKQGKRAPVNLRGENLSIETAQVRAQTDRATIGFAKDSRILKYHDTGRARGGRMRTIFPKRLSQIPVETKLIAQESAGEVLRG